MNRHRMRCLSHVEEKQLSRTVLRTGFGRTSMFKCKSSANHFSFWLPGPQWQQTLFGVLQLLYQLRMSPRPCLTKVLKFSRTTHMIFNTLLWPGQSTFVAQHTHWHPVGSVTTGQGVFGQASEGNFFDVCREMFGCRVFSPHLDLIFTAI